MTIPPYYDKKSDILRHTTTETWYLLMDIQIMLHKMNWLLRFQKLSGKCFFLNIHKPKKNPCARKIICNTYEKMNVSGDILNDGGNVIDQEDYGFIG